MSYIVLARKWRPQHFEEVVGQGHVAQTLKNSIAQDRVAHAYLFTGARGVGKTSMARILAKALNCHEGPTDTPCYKCPSCLEISSGQSVDVFEIDGASNRGINEIRELREGVRYAPSRDRYKVYIIDEVHMLTTEAFNALLKTLEEPPKHVKFVFATTEPQKIPVTILSRCQRFDFKRISQQDIVGHLENICGKENLTISKGALSLIARQANGGMRDSLSLLDQVISFAGDAIDEEQVTQILGVANRKHLFELGEAVIGRDAQRALQVLHEVHQYGYDLGQFCAEFVEHLRDLTVVSVVADASKITDLTAREIEHVEASIAHTPTELLHRLFSVMVDGAQQMSRSPYPKLILEMTLVRLCQLEPLLDIDVLVSRLRDLEGLLDDDMPAGDPRGDEGSKKKVTEHHTAPAPSLAAPPAPTPTHAPAPTTPAPVTAYTALEPAPEPAPPEQTPAPEPAPAPAPAPIAQAPAAPQPEPFVEATPEPEPAPELEPAPRPEKKQPAALGVSELDEALTHTPEPARAPEPQPAPPAPAHDERPSLEVPAWLQDDADLSGGGSGGPGEPSPDELSELFAAPPRAKSAGAGFSENPDEELDRMQVFLDAIARKPPPELDPIASEIDAWRGIVDYIREWRAPLAATLEYAHIRTFTKERLSADFVSTFYNFVNDSARLQPLEASMRAAFGPDFVVEIGVRETDEPDPDRPTLAELREAEVMRRKQVLLDHTEGHPTVVRVAELFGEGVRIRVRVSVNDV